ncbi:MAG TPA: hypothetical protein VMV96_02840 [Acidimicrobiales bacterium]|nr:hypothetical protein [Acidimicrobiales bacterium]
MSQPQQLRLDHLERLSGPEGVAEHAQGDEPIRDGGYCTDDAGRLLAVLAPHCADPTARRLCEGALAFLTEASIGDRGFRLRRRGNGTWTADAPSDDATGRALEGLGIAAARCPDRTLRERSLELFDATANWRSRYRRSVSHTVLGAASVLDVDPGHRGSREQLDHAAGVLSAGDPSATWPWPESKLTYSNALIPEALLVLSRVDDDPAKLAGGLGALEWLVDIETLDDHFSFTPVAGRGPHDRTPAFDQQPIEAWAMASACARAFEITHDRRWADRVVRAAEWFDGRNDAGIPVGDPLTGAGYDGLHQSGVNVNQGAESTLAYLAATLLRDEVTTALGSHDGAHFRSKAVVTATP